ncbi:DUF222 domain-containing protein [Geodermatophilus sp. SYSU D01180]
MPQVRGQASDLEIRATRGRRDRSTSIMCSGELGSEDLLDDVAALVAERNRIDALLARLVRAAELEQAPERDGQKSMASWLRGHCRLSTTEASRLVRNGRALEHLPALAEAHAAGLVSAEQVAVPARAVTPERLASALEQGVALALIDAVFTQVAVEQEHRDLVQVVHHHLECLDPDGREPDPTERRADGGPARRRVPHLLRRAGCRRRGGARDRAGGVRAGRPARRGRAHPRPAARRRPGAVVRQRPRRRDPADAARAQAARGGADRPR